MQDVSALNDSDAASRDGEGFGRDTGRTIGSAMMQIGLSEAAMRAIGAEGVTLILQRADALAAAGLHATLVAVWTDAAADAFHVELARVASLVTAQISPGRRH